MKITNSIVPNYYPDTWYPYWPNQHNFRTYTYPTKEPVVEKNEEVLKFAIGIIENFVLNNKPQDALDVIYALRDQKYI